MQPDVLDLALLESLRETGDYDKIAAMLPGAWQALPEFEAEAIRLRLLVLLEQNELFRKHGLCSFDRLLVDVTANPAMLLWLNGTENTKDAPN